MSGLILPAQICDFRPTPLPNPKPRFHIWCAEYRQRQADMKRRYGQWSRRKKKIEPLVFERDGWACVLCGSIENLVCDHILPMVKGGSDDPVNLMTLCRHCNCAKASEDRVGA